MVDWLKLPPEMWGEVMYFLRIPEVIYLSNVHKHLNPRWIPFYDEDYFWTRLLKNHMSERVRIFEHLNTINVKSENYCLTINLDQHCDYIYKNVGYVLYNIITHHETTGDVLTDFNK